MSVQSKKGKKAAKVTADYEGFVKRINAARAKTTDDCYTPQAVYDCVKDWVDEKIISLKGLRIRRPFHPYGDYEKEAKEYGEQDIVIDNPPFSILASIVRFYQSRGVKFFLFAPALTLFSYTSIGGVTAIVVFGTTIFENGAEVPLGFITNTEGRHRAIVAPDLGERLVTLYDEIKKTKSKPLAKINQDKHVVSGAVLRKIAQRGIEFKVPFTESVHIRKAGNKSIFGAGLLLSERLAAERLAAERLAAERLAAERLAAERLAAVKIELTEKEQNIVKIISRLSKYEDKE